MKRVMHWAVVLLVLLLTASVGLAQDATEEGGDITLIPHTDETFGFTGVVPEGWEQAAMGIFSPDGAITSTTLFGQQSAPVPADQLLNALLPQFLLTEAPESVGTVESDTLTWTLYKIEVDAVGVVVDLALTEADGTTYLVILQTPPEQYDALHESIFLPALDAFQVGVEATPEADLPYIAEDVTFDNGDVTLAGTLTLPEGDGPHPAVVLISGSGAQDRDESLAPVAAIKPFRLIADYLTRQGIAVLRYDDRGFGESTGDYASATTADFATDAEAAIDYLLTREDINAEQIGILGHSEGGAAAAMIGARNPNVAFIVSMAGSAVSGADILLVQNRRLILAEGGTEEEAEQQVQFLEEAFPLAEAGDTEALQELIYEQVQIQAETLSDAERQALGDLEAYAEQQAAFFGSEWMRLFLTYDPAEDWAQVTVPVLGVFGGNDVQVDAEQNAPALEAALEAGGNTDYEIVILPTANHLFQDAETGSLTEYGTLDPEFVDEFLPTIGDWILERVTVAN